MKYRKSLYFSQKEVNIKVIAGNYRDKIKKSVSIPVLCWFAPLSGAKAA